jgi:DNA polymerase-4
MPRTIIHVDMDAFYASIEQRDDPSLRGKPVVVGGVTGQRGVVSAASYEARRYGVHSAMPIKQARRLCPEGIFIPGHMEKYKAVSQQLRSILTSYTPLVEPLSLDEAFLDVTASIRLWGTGESIGKEIKNRVRGELDLTASAGIAPNKFLAKMASDMEKPDGLVVVKPGEEADFLRDMSVRAIHGVGKVTARRMAELGLVTIGQLAEMTREELRRLFGKYGERLHELSRGIDDDEVVPETEAKSISHEITFDFDADDMAEIRRTIGALSDRVGARLRHGQLTAGTIGIKVRLADFSTMSRERTLSEPVDADNLIFTAAWSLFQGVPRKGQKVRLLGVAASNFEQPSGQLNLFGEKGEQTRKTMRTIDSIRKKFGSDAIGRASQVKPAGETRRKKPLSSRKEHNSG